MYLREERVDLILFLIVLILFSTIATCAPAPVILWLILLLNNHSLNEFKPPSVVISLTIKPFALIKFSCDFNPSFTEWVFKFVIFVDNVRSNGLITVTIKWWPFTFIISVNNDWFLLTVVIKFSKSLDGIDFFECCLPFNPGIDFPKIFSLR